MDTTLTGFKYLGIIILIIIVVLVVIDNLGQKIKPKDPPKNYNTPNETLAKEPPILPSPPPFIGSSSKTKTETSPLDFKFSTKRLEEP